MRFPAARRLTLLPFILAAPIAASACGGGDGDGPNASFPTNRCSDFTAAHCVEVAAGDVAALQLATNTLVNDTTIVLGAGTFLLDNQVTIRNAAQVRLVGQGIDTTTLDFAPVTGQTNGVDVVGDDFLVQDLTVIDAPKDGIRVEDSDGVVFRRVRVTWRTAASRDNGAYGIYPVKSKNVLVENSRAENASDAGLYVGQCQFVVVRNNVVTGNVAGLEIENCEYADVYGNTAEGNTAGIVTFDLPGNPIVGRDVRLRDNMIRNNNLMNFAPGGTVAQIPAGTGTFAMAARRVEITGNTYLNNDTVDIGIISGLNVAMAMDWELATSRLVGTWNDLGLTPGSAAGTIRNYRTQNVVVANNTHSGSGTHPDGSKEFGLLAALAGGDDAVPSVLYDGFGESMHHTTDPSMNSNDNHICVGGNTNGSFTNVNIEVTRATPTAPSILVIPHAPFGPYDCTTLEGGPVTAPTLDVRD